MGENDETESFQNRRKTSAPDTGVISAVFGRIITKTDTAARIVMI
jgi:hypothetical protein